jgi:hypothetical protein
VLGFILAKLASMVVVNQQQGEAGAKGEKGEAGAPGGVPAMLFGSVSAAGAKVTGSAGWTSAKIEAGRYRITFTAPFAAFSTPVACSGNDLLLVSTINTKNSFDVFLRTASTSVRTDSEFTFFCSGG